MKKLSLAIILVFTIVKIEGQTAISVNQSDIANANTQVILSNANILNVNANAISATGPNSTWNFTNLNFVTQDTLAFSTPSSAPYFLLNNSFVSTYVNKGVFALPAIPNFPSVTDVSDFFKKSSADLRQVGIGITLSGIPIPTFYNPVDKVYKFPMNYNNVDSSSSKFSIQVPTLGYYGANINRKNTVDGWGTLTTPYGTFQVLRIKSVVNRTDSLKLDTLLPFGFSFPRPTLIEYKWIGKSQKYPLLQINTNDVFGTETIVSVQYQDSLRTVGINDIAKKQSNAIVLKSLGDGRYQLSRNINTQSDVYLFDFNGKQIQQLSWSNFDISIELPEAIKNCFAVIATNNDVKTFKLSR